MRVQFDAAKVHDPGKSGRIGDYNFFGGSAGRERQSDGTQPGWAILWRALLIKCLRLGAVDETLENNWPIANSSKRTRRDREIVLNKFELGNFRLGGKIKLRRVRDLDLAPFNREHLVV